MLLKTKIKELMTKEVVCVQPTDSMMKVSNIFEQYNFHHVLVKDEDNQLVGIISKHDFNKMLTTFSVFKNSRAEVANRRYKMAFLVKDVMTSQVVRLHPNDAVTVALGIFKENLFHALPVVDDNNRVVGILSTFDLLNFAFAEDHLRAGNPSRIDRRARYYEELPNLEMD